MINKALTERDILEFINLYSECWLELIAATRTKWELSFTDGRIIYFKENYTRKSKADYILCVQINSYQISNYWNKDNKKSVRSGMQQALEYSK
jgi:type I site-specific restriction endonuclease